MTSDSVKEGQVFCLGNPLLDIQAAVEPEFLTKYNLKADDAVLCDDKLIPLFEEMMTKYKPEYIAGGSTENTSRIAQWILGKPNVIVFTGCIGKDEYGRILEKQVRTVGVKPLFQIHPTEKTGTCACCITGHSRSLCAHLAAANHFTKDHLDKKCWSAVEAAQFYYIASFVLTVSPDSIVAIGEHAAAKDKPFMMNLSAPFLISVFKDPMVKALPYVDILFGNETEALEFAKVHEFGTADMAQIALKLAALPKKNEKRSRTVVITQGAESVIVAQDGKTQSFPVAKLDKDRIVDTNGAGDAFAGGFLAQYIQGSSMEKCVNCGIWAAQIIIQHSGCTHPAKADYTH